MPKTLALVLLIASAAVAPADRIDDYVKAQLKETKVPGMAVAVIKDGRVVKAKGYGLAMVEHDVPATPETLFELASLSKQFTAVATMMLVEEGKVGLDDPVSKYFEGTPESWSPMKVRHLLNHTSGLVEFHMDPLKLSATSLLRYGNTAQVRDMAKQGLLFAPGTKWAYSNAGYTLLGLIVEKASGQPFYRFVEERILRPTGMSRTRFVDPFDVIKGRAETYTLRSGNLAVWRMASTLGALDQNAFGGMLSSVNDLARWEAAVSAGKLLKPETWQMVLTPEKLPDGKPVGIRNDQFGYGWWLTPWKGRTLIGHTGHTGTAIIRNPADKVTVILLGNLGSGNPPPFGSDRGFNPWRVAEGVLDLAVGK
jgi:CubicO group peptidase (beta-lactamase class C family)